MTQCIVVVDVDNVWWEYRVQQCGSSRHQQQCDEIIVTVDSWEWGADTPTPGHTSLKIKQLTATTQWNLTNNCRHQCLAEKYFSEKYFIRKYFSENYFSESVKSISLCLKCFTCLSDCWQQHNVSSISDSLWWQHTWTVHGMARARGQHQHHQSEPDPASLQRHGTVPEHVSGKWSQCLKFLNICIFPSSVH